MTPACRTVIDSALAAATPAGPTSAGMTAPRVGWFTAAKPETQAVSTHSTAQVARRRAAAPARASSALVTAAPVEVMSISRRRSIASAIAPPSRPKTISGTSATIEVTPTSSDEPVSGRPGTGRRPASSAGRASWPRPRRTAAGRPGCAAASCRSPSRAAEPGPAPRPARAALDRVDRRRRSLGRHGASRCTIQPPPSASSRTNRSRSCSRSAPPCQNSTRLGHHAVAAPDRRARHRPVAASARRAAAPARSSSSRESTTVDCTEATAASCEPRGRGSHSAVGGGVADPLDPAGHPHLPLQRVPREDQRRPRVDRQLRALGRGVAGAEDEAGSRRSPSSARCGRRARRRRRRWPPPRRSARAARRRRRRRTSGRTARPSCRREVLLAQAAPAV